jgi:parallel beta-helix repeat protein
VEGRHGWKPGGWFQLLLGSPETGWDVLEAEPWGPLGYEDWVDAFFPPDKAGDPAWSGFEAAPAGDGIANLLKYASGVAPFETASRRVLPRLERVGSEWVLTYPRSVNATEAVRQVELSEDLLSWETAGEEEIVELGGGYGVPPDGEAVFWVQRFSEETSRGFARVRAGLAESALTVSGVVAGWDLANLTLETQTIPQPATRLDPLGQTDGLRRGPGLQPQGPNRSWGAASWGDANGNPYPDAAAAVAAGKYFYFTIEPGTVETLTYTALFYRIRRTSSAPRDFLWQFRVGDGPFTDIGQPVNYTGNETDGRAQPPLDLSAIKELRGVAEPVTFRLVAWNGTGTFSLGRDHGESLALLVEQRGVTVASILRDGNGDFDPWNETRWAAWHSNGNLIRSFDLDTSVIFAEREDPWTPDLSEFGEERLFTVNKPGIAIEGNGVVIDVRPAAYRNRTLDQVYAGGLAESNATIGLFQGFQFTAPAAAGLPPTRIRNLTLKGFEQAVRTLRANTHPLVITQCVFTRNAFGSYLSSFGATVENCHYLENGRGAFYAGSGSSRNEFINNAFRDNNYVINLSYGDMVFDTSYGNLVRDNRFQPSLASQSHWRVGISFFRNQGEDGRLREDYPRDNLVTGNRFQGYSLAINAGARHGRAEHVHDLSREGRDYVSYNRIESNRIQDGALGIKLNTSGNTIEGNTFVNVQQEIVLHCVAYNLIETVINNQPESTVRFWTERSDYSAYAERFPFQLRLMDSINAPDKLIHVRSDYGAPAFARHGAATLVLTPTLITDSAMRGTYSSGGTPVDFAVGNFHETREGDEIAVIWDEPVSQVRGTDYHTILFFDSNGIEINRAGRSIHRWGGITSGRFTNQPGHEVAVFPSEPIDGSFPVFIHRRGFAEPHHVLLEDNSRKIRAIAGGRFKEGESLDGLAVIFEEGPADILFLQPGNPSWSAEAASPVRLTGIAAGRFDPSRPGLDQVAAISADPYPETGTYPVIFFAPGAGGPFALSANQADHPWGAVGAGDFDKNRSGAEVVVSSLLPISGGYRLRYFHPGEDTAFRVVEDAPLAVPPARLASGNPSHGQTPTLYERVEGGEQPGDFRELAAWGTATLFLPSARQGGAIPVFWMKQDPADGVHQYWKVTPLVR